MTHAKDLIQICEMANAIQKYTGISGVVYFCTSEELSNLQAHRLGRVKLFRSGQWASCSIKRDKSGARITDGTDKRMVSDLESFVEANEDVLWEYWNTPMDVADSAATMQKFKRI